MPDVNPAFLYLLEWFYDLKKTTEPITYQEIESWNNLCQVGITQREVFAIIQIDMEYNFPTKKDK